MHKTTMCYEHRDHDHVCTSCVLEERRNQDRITTG
jgi:hypothetical protein